MARCYGPAHQLWRSYPEFLHGAADRRMALHLSLPQMVENAIFGEAVHEGVGVARSRAQQYLANSYLDVEPVFTRVSILHRTWRHLPSDWKCRAPARRRAQVPGQPEDCTCLVEQAQCDRRARAMTTRRRAASCRRAGTPGLPKPADHHQRDKVQPAPTGQRMVIDHRRDKVRDGHDLADGALPTPRRHAKDLHHPRQQRHQRGRGHARGEGPPDHHRHGHRKSTHGA